MTHHRLTQIEDYELLVGKQTVERIRQKGRQIKRPAGREFQFHLLRRRRGRDDFLANTAHEQPRTAHRVARHPGHSRFFLDHKENAQRAARRRDRSLQQEGNFRTSDLREQVRNFLDRDFVIARSAAAAVNGSLVSSIVDAAERIVQLINNRKLRDEMGRKTRETVRENFC